VLTDWNFVFGWHGYDKAPTFLFAELVHNNVLRIKSRTYDGSLSNVNWWDVSKETLHYSAPMPRGQWVDFVFNYRFDHRQLSNGGIGFIKAWVNGVQVVDYTGPVGYLANAGDRSAYFWMGSYAGDRNEHYRIYNYDEVRFGDASATYSDVAPGGSVIRPAAPVLTTVQ
jgi:Polysaccharide lyase